MENVWTKQHCGSTLPDGQKIASYSGVNAALSHLSTAFRLINRVGDWDHQRLLYTNPIKSDFVSSYRSGYRLWAWKRGYEESSAVPITEATLFEFINGLDKDIAGTSDEQMKLIFERDICTFLYLWYGQQRGKECGRLTISDLWTLAGISAFPLVVPIAPDFQLQVSPNGTKTVKGRRANCITLPAVPVPRQQYCFINRLAIFSQHCQQYGWPIRRYLFRPERSNKVGFLDQPLTSKAIQHQYQTALERHGLCDGHTLHGVRRGGMQHRHHVLGESEDSVGAQALIVTKAIVKRYLDPSRHHYRVVKYRGKKQKALPSA